MTTQALKSQVPPNKPIQFIDLKAQQAKLQPGIDQAIKKVLDHGRYIMGPEVAELEGKLSEFCGAKHSISCSNGTDALALILIALKVKPGDAVFVPSFTFAATAEVVAWLGAKAVFVDVDAETFNVCPEDLKRAIQWAKDEGLNARGIITVDLFGLPAEYDEIEAIANENNIWVLDDAAQGFGGVYKNRKIGTIGIATATSFFPAKPLGCYGDGGAVFTEDDELAEILKSLRVHGKGSNKYDNVRIGMNGRLDTMQAAILLEKLSVFEDEIKARQKVAERYNEAFEDHVQTPLMFDDRTSAWAQYTVVLKDNHDRAGIADALQQDGVPTAIYYPKPLHQQPAYQHFGRSDVGLPNSEALSQRVLSLPMHPYMDDETQGYITETFIKAVS